jgi:NAD(P)-dependent dehydrogenase (short-subunit alcohol dehydrogenase family)
LGLSESTAVITGGSKGMGKATCLCLAAEGTRVAVLARGRAGLDETVAACLNAGARDAVGISTDLKEKAPVADAFRQVADRWGQLNVLVNTVGPDEYGTRGFDRTDDDEWLAAFNVGTLAAVRCVRETLPLLRKASWARIVNVSAHSTKRQAPSLIAYTAAKAATTSVGTNLSQWLAPEGILENTVSPGTFMTDGLRGYLEALPAERHIELGDLWDAMRIIKEDFGHPAFLGRAGDPSEIARVIVFAASRANTYMTGADLNVDGGSDFT